jgi:signal transduction histidine kinase
MDNDLTEEQLTVSGNEQLLKTAFINLMDNACKYSENQKVEIHLASKEHKLIVEFSDKGIGVSEDDIPHLFEPFFRSKNVGLLQGHGIGLSLVERIVRLHNGYILFWSKPNKGTKVSLVLPLILKKIN